MQKLGFVDIFLLVLQGVIAFYIIKGIWLIFLQIFTLVTKRYLRTGTYILDELVWRATDTKRLVEEMHGLMTKQITIEDINKIRPFLRYYKWTEITADTKDCITHYGPSEIESFLSTVRSFPKLYTLDKFCEKYTPSRGLHWQQYVQHWRDQERKIFEENTHVQ